MGQVDYELSDGEYAANEVEDTWVQALLAALAAYLNTLQPLLTPANYEQLVSLLLEKVITLQADNILLQIHSLCTCAGIIGLLAVFDTTAGACPGSR